MPLGLDWEKYSRFTLDMASAASGVGFSAAKVATQTGFAITRGVASSVAGLTGATVDYALFGSSLGMGPALGSAVASAFSFAEQVALFPIHLGESIASSSIVAAQSSIDTLSTIFPGSDEASFSLASFVTLVRKEWNDPAMAEYLPEERYGVAEIARALIAWGALQGVTHDWQVKEWMKHLKEISLNEEEGHVRTRLDSRVHVTGDVILPGNNGQIITADIGDSSDAPLTPTQEHVDNLPPSDAAPIQFPVVFPSLESGPSLATLKPSSTTQPRRRGQPSNSETKATLRRLSKMVLAGYGGAGLIFFGVSPFPTAAVSRLANATASTTATEMKSNEEARLTDAIDASEDANAAQAPAGSKPPPAPEPEPKYSWWNVLMGRHDHEIFERYAGAGNVVIGNEMRMPRFWVLTDHSRKQIVLVLRGTMSLNELAVDLTCEAEAFEPACATTDEESDEDNIPGSFPFPFPSFSRGRSRVISSASFFTTAPAKYQVHSGMLRMAHHMGDPGKPVQIAVRDALKRNRGYELVLCGHSLGAGVAGLLALFWADPQTCKTVKSSGLPVGRRVSAYCFAPPCFASAALAKLSSKLITSFVYSHDVVSRLSLGSIRDMIRASAWLCNANATAGSEEGYNGVTKRAMKWKTGFGSMVDPPWFLSIRKTLEANMHMANLFPPGRVWWAIGDAHLQAKGQTTVLEGKLRLFEVTDVEKVFSQIVFARDMLSSHLPHQYDRVLHDLL